MKLLLKYIWCLLLPIHFMHAEGIVEGTIVQLSSGYVAVEQLKVGSTLACLSNNLQEQTQQCIVQIRKVVFERWIRLSINGEVLEVSPTQKIYLPLQKQWGYAQELKVGDMLLRYDGSYIAIDSVQDLYGSKSFYQVALYRDHIFSVTSCGIIIHNAFPIVVGVTIASDLTIEWFFGVAFFSAVSSWLGLTLSKDRNGKTKITTTLNGNDIGMNGSSGGAFHDPRDPKKRNTDKVGNMHDLFKQDGFGKMLKESSRKTKDIDPHTNSQVYEVTQDMKEYGLKKGDKFYLDKYHGDHIEVFRGKNSLMVVNIDGTINSAKTNSAFSRTYHAS